jgi:hypothetical protein
MDDLYSINLPRPIPNRIRALPIDKGRPVPYFIRWDQFGRPTQQVDPEKIARCVEHRRCYSCGDRLGPVVAYHARVSTGVSRLVPEPAMCVECAEWFAIAFDPPQAEPLLVWTTSEPSKVVARDARGVITQIGEPLWIKAFAMNREATPAEIRATLQRDLVTIRELSIKHGNEDAVERRVSEFERTLARCGVGYLVVH